MYLDHEKKIKESHRVYVFCGSEQYLVRQYMNQVLEDHLPREEWDAYLTWLEHYEYDLLGLPRPDRVLFLDMPLEVSQKLLVGRYEGDAAKRDIHERDMRYLTTCRASALYAAERLGWSVIPCAENGEPLSVESITARLIESL